MATVDVALAAAATLVAVAFALSTWDRYERRGQPQHLAWTVSLVLFAAGSAALWWGFARGWSGPSFRVFYLCGAILNVPWLALGTVHLVATDRFARTVRGWLILLSGFAAGVLAVAPLRAPVPPEGLPEGRELFGPLPRALAAIGSGVAALVIIGGALLTTWQFVRRRRATRRRVVGNLLIAAGTLVLSASGTLAGRLGEERAFVVTLLAGVIVLFAGFLVASAPLRPPGSAQRAPEQLATEPAG